MSRHFRTPSSALQPGTDRMICSTVHGIDGMRATVLFDGEYYVVNKHLLAALERGETPGELDLEPAEIEEAA